MKKSNLTKKIFVGFTFGIIIGILLNFLKSTKGLEASFLLTYSEKLIEVFKFGGDLFLRILKMIVVPVVFFSLISGVSNLKNLKSLGRIGIKSFSLYLITTFFAISASLTIASFINPGKNKINLGNSKEVKINDPPSISDILIDIVPENPFKSLSDGNMLQIIFFALLIGSAISILKKNNLVLNLFNDLNRIIMKILDLVMIIAPYGIFCLISQTFATQGISTIFELLKYFLVVIFCLFFHVAFIYCPMIKIFGRTSLLNFFKSIKNVILFAFSTSSSSATIPVTLENLQKNLKIKKKIASFTVPLGATINMDGTAIMQGVATIFIANIYGFNLLFSDFISIILTATLASIGTAGVPGVGIIMLGMVLTQVGLPLEGIAIILGVDRFLDMLRTSVNVIGDSTVSLLIDRTEK